MARHTDGQIDRPTDGWSNGRTDRQMMGRQTDGRPDG